MFKTLCGLGLAVPAFAGAGGDLSEMQCHGMVTSSGTLFNIGGVEGDDDYELAVDGGTLTINYCTFVEGADAYAVFSKQNGGELETTAVATKPVLPTQADDIDSTDGETTLGITFTQESDSLCSGETNYSVTTKLLCDEAITDAPTFETTVLDQCVFTVTMSHKDGCADFDVDVYVNWLEDNEWFLGILYLVVGPLLAFFGLQWFPYVTAILIAFFIFALVTSLGLAMGWMNTTGGLIAVLAVGAVLGIGLGIVVKRRIWIMIALLGLVAGFFSGALVFALISSATGWTAAWGWWVISILMALIGAFVAYCLGKPVILFATSFVGAYLFMRAFTLFFPGHWPSEAQLMSDASSVEVDSVFWVFVGLFGVTFLAGFCVQKKRDKVHEDLDAYQRA